MVTAPFFSHFNCQLLALNPVPSSSVPPDQPPLWMELLGSSFASDTTLYVGACHPLLFDSLSFASNPQTLPPPATASCLPRLH